MKSAELTVDTFAGGGGASLGIKMATGRAPDLAINHDAAAIAMHAANHPETKHITEDVWRVSPRQATGGRDVGLLWCSPDCRHFSRAKGSKPVEKKIRSLAWVMVSWASTVQPRVMIMENVREIEDWGPVVPRWRCQACDWRGTEGQAVLVRKSKRCPRCESRKLAMTADMVPDPSRKGLTFRRFVGRLKAQGYVVAWKVLDSADYGAPTHRRRLFLVARRDGQPIVWPEQTHGDPRHIGRDFFSQDQKPWRTAAECIDWSLPVPSIFERKKPLAEATMRRIAMGIKRYVLDNPRPFLVCCNHGGDEFRGQELDRPMPTLTAARDTYGLVSPYLVRCAHGDAGRWGHGDRSLTDPIPTVTASKDFAIVAPTLIQTGYGERAGQAPRSLDINAPMGTIVAGGSKQALVTAWIIKHFGGAVGAKVDSPLPTTLMRGTQNQLAAATLVHMNHGDKQWSDVESPMRTITSGNHAALVYAFLTKYFRTAIGQPADEPLGTTTVRHRFGLVTVIIDEQEFVIVDIGMRMLRPRELARGQGFPDSYVLTGNATNQVARIGNSVCPDIAAAMVLANYSSRVADLDLASA